MASHSRNHSSLEVPPAPTTPVGRPGLQSTSSKPVTAHRLPPPALFQGPPSRNASYIDLPGDKHSAPDSDGQNRTLPRPSRVPLASSFSGPALRQPPTQADDFRAESLWAEMQKTLADVELSAMNPSRIFGAEHGKALEDLRTAQLSLAQAWARSEADEIEDHDFDDVVDVNSSPIRASASPSSKRGKDDGKSAAFNSKKNLEEETERDIQLARKRREANDRYFQKVNTGVLDVVSKLDEVANAMRRVERESREIWNESGDDSGSGRDSAGGTDASLLRDSPLSVR